MIVYPAEPYKSKPDNIWAREYWEVKNLDFPVGLYDDVNGVSMDYLPFHKVLYRGWMGVRPHGNLVIPPSESEILADASRWYGRVEDLTIPMSFVATKGEVPFGTFVRGTHKSFGLKSFVHTNQDLNDIPELPVYCVRPIVAIEDERRYFMSYGEFFGREPRDLELTLALCDRLKAFKFVSIDTGIVNGYRERVVEIGDGQVSDIKEWDVDEFVEDVLLPVRERLML